MSTNFYPTQINFAFSLKKLCFREKKIEILVSVYSEWSEASIVSRISIKEAKIKMLYEPAAEADRPRSKVSAPFLHVYVSHACLKKI